MKISHIENTVLRRICVVVAYSITMPVLLSLVAVFIAWELLFAVRDAVASVFRAEFQQFVFYHHAVCRAWRRR